MLGMTPAISCLQLLDSVVLIHIFFHVWLSFFGDNSKGMWAWLATDLPLPTCTLL
jgi:hypothetical protein